MAKVINRKFNRTVNQNVAQSDPKWVDQGGGVISRKVKSGEVTHTHFLTRGKDNKWEGVRKNAQPLPVVSESLEAAQ